MDLELTKAEERVMKILWKLKKGVVRDIINGYDEPKPAYTTVATILKILEKKGFVTRKPIANSFEYRPLVKKSDYTNGIMKSLVKNYFSNSFKNLISDFSKNENLSTEEMESILEYFKKKLSEKKKK